MSSMKTMVQAVRLRAEQSGEKPAFIFRDKAGGRRAFSFQQCYDLGGRWAAVLRSRPIGRGDFVVNTLPNSPERVISDVGIFLSGAVSVNGHCQLADGSDLFHVLRKSGASAIILDPDIPYSPLKVLQKHVKVDDKGTAASEELPSLRHVFKVRRVETGGQEDFLGHLETLTEHYTADDVKPDDALSVFTTSGSTGFSKLVVHTNETLDAQFTANSVLAADPEWNTDFSTAPLGWVGGYTGLTFLTGCARVLCDNRSGVPEDMAELARKCIQEERCTKVFVPPALVLQIAERVQHQKEVRVAGVKSNASADDACVNDKHASSKLSEGRQQEQEIPGVKSNGSRPSANITQLSKPVSSTGERKGEQEFGAESHASNASSSAENSAQLNDNSSASPAQMGGEKATSTQTSGVTLPSTKATGDASSTQLDQKAPPSSQLTEGRSPSSLLSEGWSESTSAKSSSYLSLHSPASTSVVREDSKEQYANPWDWLPDCFILGGCPITRDMVQAARSLARSVLVGYGCSECFGCFFHTFDDADTFVDHDAGIALSGLEFKIVDLKDEENVLPTGEFGQLLLKSSALMTGYLNDPEATEAAFTNDGYFRTGDVACLDDRGHLTVQGRGSDAIMRGPYIFYPGWLEARIRSCPDVHDVVVVGVPDPLVNEELCACLVLTSDDVTVEEVRQFVEKDILSSEDDPLSPRPRHYLKFKEFPKTFTDKNDRKTIKKMAATRLSENKSRKH